MHAGLSWWVRRTCDTNRTGHVGSLPIAYASIITVARPEINRHGCTTDVKQQQQQEQQEQQQQQQQQHVPSLIIYIYNASFLTEADNNNNNT